MIFAIGFIMLLIPVVAFFMDYPQFIWTNRWWHDPAFFTGCAGVVAMLYSIVTFMIRYLP